MYLADYSHESCLPCRLPEIVSNLKTKTIKTVASETIGLKKNILAIPLNRGYFLCADNIVLVTDKIDFFKRLD